MWRPLRALLIALAALVVQAPARAGDFAVMGYLASWSAAARPALFDELDVSRLTHIIYAFGDIGEDGSVALADPCAEIGRCDGGPGPRYPVFSRLGELKRLNPKLKVLVAFGGWNGSSHFSEIAATPEGRERFARSVIDTFFRPYPGLFDGVDIDWEYPVGGGLTPGRPEDRDNLAALLSTVRGALDVAAPENQRHELGIAVSASPEMIDASYPPTLAAHVDHVNVMSYDYHVGSAIAHHNAPLFALPDDPTPTASVAASLRAWRDAGVPADRLVLGIPFYARAFADVATGGDGLLQPADPAGTAAWSGEGFAYRDLVAKQPEKAGFRRYWSEAAAVPYLHDAVSRVFITYDDPRSVALKTAFARDNGFGGIMAWELGGDDGTLLDAVATEAAQRPGN